MLRYRLAVYFAIVSVSLSASACEHSLDGHWISDANTSMTYIRANSKLQKKAEEFLSTLLGKMTMTFSNGILHQEAPDTEVNVNGQMKPFKGFKEDVPYRVLFCNQFTVVWAARPPFANEEEATTFNFVDADNAWVYTGSSEPNMPDVHGREYFKRVH